MPRLYAFATAALFAFAPLAGAQETIATDRPGFAFSPVVVPQGAFQVEVGLPQITRSSFSLGEGDDDVTATLLNFPTGLRYGVLPRLELRVNSSLFNRASTDIEDAESTSGFGDVELGVKYQVLQAGDGVPNLSLIPSVVLPIGEEGFSAGDAVINANAAAGFALPSGLGATLVAGATVPTADGATVNANLVALVGRSFSSALSGYVELATFPTDGATPFYAGAGLAYLVSPLVQLDAFFDAGLNDDAVDFIGGVGVSARFGR